MAVLTFQVLEGMERGRIISDLEPPLTIGREEDNGIQLNDERVSRFHAKIQEDSGRIILTDLESTNGSRVNGHPVQMHVLRIGDQVSIGRCLLLYGSADEIEAHVTKRRKALQDESSGKIPYESEEFEFLDPTGRDDGDELPRLFPDGPPDIPEGLTPLQVAEMTDLLAHLHDRLRSVIESGRTQPSESEEDHSPTTLDWIAWQRTLQLEMELAQYLRGLANPGADE